MKAQTTCRLDPRIFGKGIVMEDWYALRQFERMTQSACTKSKGYVSLFFYQWCTYCASRQTFHREVNGLKPISHPNVLPVIEVSKTQFPFCIASPWMPDGNIIQYTQMNPGANPLTLVCTHQLEP
jgi:hypothetical protein